MADFHFLRSEYLWLLLPALLAVFLWVKKTKLSGQWQQVIAPALQPYVLKQTQQSLQKTHLKLILLGCVLLAIIAMAGPSWQQQKSQVYSSQAGLVIALDLSLSMTAQDVAPSRLQRAKYKITDILNQLKDQNIALLAYAGDAHMVSPLTQDSNTIKAMLPALDPYIMPTGGSNLMRLAEQAVDLFEQSNSQPRQLLLVTDGVETQDIDSVSQLLRSHHIQLSILPVGTEQGAPLVQPNGQFFKDSKGNVIMPSLELDELKQLAQTSGGEIRTLSNTDADINALLNNTAATEQFTQQNQDVTFDQWVDNGFYLLIPLALFSLVFFRKGLILVCILALMPISNESWAQEKNTTATQIDHPKQSSNFTNLFLNNDQQAKNIFESDPAKASELFDDAKWKASSFYKAGEYEKALSQWQQFDDADSLYNQGNALAQLQKIDEAIVAYDHALALDPTLQDAIDNKALLEQIKQQQDQQPQDGQNSDQQNSDSENPEQSDSNQQNSDNQQAKQQDGKQQDGKQQDGQQQDGQQQNSQQQSGEPSQDENPTDQQQTEAEKQREEKLNAQRQQQAEQQAQDDQDLSESSSSQVLEKSNQQMEQEQAMQQWMERIPDDPGGLLRNKFLYQYKNRQRNDEQTERKPW